MIYQPTTSVHDAARVQRQRIQKMPIRRQQRSRSVTAACLAVMGWVGALAGEGSLAAGSLVIALVMSLVAAVQFRQSRRGM